MNNNGYEYVMPAGTYRVLDGELVRVVNSEEVEKMLLVHQELLIEKGWLPPEDTKELEEIESLRFKLEVMTNDRDNAMRQLKESMAETDEWKNSSIRQTEVLAQSLPHQMLLNERDRVDLWKERFLWLLGKRENMNEQAYLKIINEWSKEAKKI